MIKECALRLPDQFVGTPIWDYEWDICCVLDGCRVDTFREFHPDAGAYWSVASSSKQWIQRTFRAMPDDESVGYVTANPFSSDVLSNSTVSLAHLHQEPVDHIEEYDIETVAPETLTERALAAWQHHDLDRLIIHYMQPHVPFRSKPGWFSEFVGTGTWGSQAWKQTQDDIFRVRWLEAYRDNLSWVLDDGVGRLQECINATILLTSDHANAAGEWGIYGHPNGVVAPAIRKVPHLVVEAGGSDDKTRDMKAKTWDEKQQRRQLEALGYRS